MTDKTKCVHNTSINTMFPNIIESLICPSDVLIYWTDVFIFYKYIVKSVSENVNIIVALIIQNALSKMLY
jgi:hypothetical protein